MINCEILRKNADKIWEANYNHPFVQGIGDGGLDVEIFKHYLRQDYVYLIAFSRFFGLAAAKGENLAQMQTLSKILEATLNVEMDLHRQICSDFGITPAELEATRPAPNCLAYTSYLLASAHQGDAVDILAALLPCSWGYIEIANRLKEKGLPEEKHYRQWIETYSSAEFWDLNEWLKSEFDRLAQVVSKSKARRLQEIFDYSSLWEYMFWEMAYQKQDWPINLQ
jgi:thiaminase/transcriptional activator TenA